MKSDAFKGELTALTRQNITDNNQILLIWFVNEYV